MAQNGCSRCDLQIGQYEISLTPLTYSTDRTLLARFDGRAGDPGATWTLAAYKSDYPYQSNPQTLLIRVAPLTADFSAASGRVGLGLIQETVKTDNVYCPQMHIRAFNALRN